MEFTPVWDVPIALYLFLAGLGGGAFITSALAAWRHPNATIARKAGRWIAPIAVAVGLVLLMLDARAGFQNPLRFALLLHNTGSVMTWGVYFLAIFEVIALIVLIMEIIHKKVPHWLDLLGSIFGICVGAYTGCLLGVVHTFPLWNNAILPVLFLVSAVSTGMASVMLVTVIESPKEEESLTSVNAIHYWLPIAEVVLVAAMLFIVNTAGAQAHATVVSLLAGQFAPMFWIGFILIGLVIPIIIDSIGKFGKKPNPQFADVCSFVGVLIGGYLLRYLIVTAALPVTIVVPAIM